MQVLFGGTFDPFHNGHAAMIRTLCATFPDAQVSVIPNRLPPHRQASASAQHRLHMLSLGLPERQQIEISRIEIDRAGPSYSVRTLEDYRHTFGDREPLVLCMGADAARKLDQWHAAARIPTLAHVCILDRDGESAVIPGFSGQLNETEAAGALNEQPCGLVFRLQTPEVPVSSTQVREMIRAGVDRLPVPEPIQHYIQTHALYQDAE